jgi:hypothetical protein
MAVFWVVALCSLAEVYRRFRGACCLHHQDDGSCSSYTIMILLTKPRLRKWSAPSVNEFGMKAGGASTSLVHVLALFKLGDMKAHYKSLAYTVEP